VFTKGSYKREKIKIRRQNLAQWAAVNPQLTDEFCETCGLFLTSIDVKASELVIVGSQVAVDKANLASELHLQMVSSLIWSVVVKTALPLFSIATHKSCMH